MPSFIYKAVDALGDEMPGTVQAGDISSAIASLQSQALTVLSIREVEGSLNIAAQLRRLATLRTPTTTHKASFFRQVAMLLKGGHTLTEALALCAATSDRKPLHDGIVHMLVRIHNGETSFAGAVRDLDRLFPPFVASLLATGERSGELVTALERVADHL
ncbi:MAG: type II secretion system F family protein, partial [Pseudomonadota bacterium]